MSTQRIVRLAVVICLSMAGVDRVQADDFTGVTEWMSVGSGLLGAGESIEVDFLLTDDEGGIVGFEVRFDYSEAVPDASWASDVQVVLETPSAIEFIVGGFTNVGDAVVLWSFDGPGSDGPGIYGDSGSDIFLPWKTAPQSAGTYHLTFSNDWFGDENANQYDGIEVRFYTLIPGPGALAMLAVAGLGRTRRRSRDA
jgi:hypothetical protein